MKGGSRDERSIDPGKCLKGDTSPRRNPMACARGKPYLSENEGVWSRINIRKLQGRYEWREFAICAILGFRCGPSRLILNV